MKTLTINIVQKSHVSYDIFIGTKLLEELPNIIDLTKYSKIAIITDTNLAKHHLHKLQESTDIQTTTIVVPPGEQAKTLEHVELIWKELSLAKADRKSLVINLGGGVIGDMGGFAASTYMRGIDFINIPTTILAQVDESVGGKTGFDFEGIKNLIGTFQQPAAVIIDVSTVQTLPEREFVSGFAEIIKHGLIVDKEYFQTVTAKKPREFSEEELIEIITGSCGIKQKVVEEDTTEKGLRKVVNFGHTIGHAIEAILLQTEHPLLHGEAVSIGVVAEAKISQLKNYLSEKDVQLIKTSLQNAGLPVSINNISTDAILEKMKGDKKSVSGKVGWTLLKEIGTASYDEEVDIELVNQAIDFISHE